MAVDIQADQRRVLVDGAEVPLGARAFDVLVYLNANADRVVSKEELLTHVWSGLMVEDSNLTVQIAGLRKALGAQAIKTVPGVGYKLTLRQAAPKPGASPPLPAPTVPSIPSLAVLPFANLTGSADRDYVVDGIVNEIIAALSRISAFFVISSTSTNAYKGRVVDLREVGRELGVRYVLEGSIQQSGNAMRISTQLVEAETGHPIWRDRFEGLASNIFELQDRVTEHVAGALEPKLILAEAVRAQAKPTSNLAAYDLCLRATPLVLRQNSLEALEQGMALLRQALALDPKFIRAKGMLCLAYTGAFATRFWSFERASAVLPIAREVLDSGTEDALALTYAGHHMAYIGRDHQAGLTALKRASILNPNSATVAMLRGWVHNYMGQNAEAIEHLTRARRLSPLDPQIGVMSCGIGNALLQLDDAENAVIWLEQAVSEYPEFASTHVGLIGCYWRLGRFEDSARIAAWFRAKVPDMSIAVFLKTGPQTSQFYRDLLVEALRGNGFPD